MALFSVSTRFSNRGGGERVEQGKRETGKPEREVVDSCSLERPAGFRIFTNCVCFFSVFPSSLVYLVHL